MIKSVLILLVGLMVFSSLSHGQTGSYEWALPIGGPGFDEGHSVAVDGAGNAYYTGVFLDTVDFDPGTGVQKLISDGQQDIFISKLDSDGFLIWAKRIGSIGRDGGYSIAIDHLNNVYTTGIYSGPVDFNPDTGAFILPLFGGSVYISKLNENGQFVWAKQLGGDHGNSLVLDASGNVFSTGYFVGTGDFDPDTSTYNLTSAGTGDIFISKLNENGHFVWAKQMGGILSDEGLSIELDDAGNVYTTGYFFGTSDFDPDTGTFNLISQGAEDIFISKLDTNGSFVWAKRIGGTLPDGGNSITADATGNVYLTGYFHGTVDFDPGPGTFNLTSEGVLERDMFICKLDANGQFLWAKQKSTTGWDEGSVIRCYDSGDIYVLGAHKGVLIAKIDVDGNFIWEQYFESVYGIWGNSIDVDGSGNIYSTGTFQTMADFDPGASTFNLSTDGSFDIFIHKMDGIAVQISENKYSPEYIAWPNPTNGVLNIDLGKSYRTATILVKDITGHHVSSNTFASSQFVKIDLACGSGIYLVEIFIEEQLSTILKVIKNNN